MRQSGKMRLLVAGLALAALIGSFASGALASHTFSDVPSGAYYHDSVDAIAAAGITSGCGGGKFCPDKVVTRGQMAVFLDRLGNLSGLDDYRPVVDALTTFSRLTYGQPELFSLSTNQAEQCFDSVQELPPESEIPYAIVGQVTLASGPSNPANVNMVIHDPDREDGLIQVCFKTLDGTQLASFYRVDFVVNLFLGAEAYRTAAQRARVARFMNSGRVASKPPN